MSADEPSRPYSYRQTEPLGFSILYGAYQAATQKDKDNEGLALALGRDRALAGQSRPYKFVHPKHPGQAEGPKIGRAPPIKTPGQKEKEKDKERQDEINRGRLVSQVTPGKLRKDDTILATLLQQIIDFFKNITNPPTPIQNVLEKYPAPPYTTTEVSPRLSVA